MHEPGSGSSGSFSALSSRSIHHLTHNSHTQTHWIQSLCVPSRVPGHSSPFLHSQPPKGCTSVPLRMPPHPLRDKKCAKLLACTKGPLLLRGAPQAPNFSSISFCPQRSLAGLVECLPLNDCKLGAESEALMKAAIGTRRPPGLAGFQPLTVAELPSVGFQGSFLLFPLFFLCSCFSPYLLYLPSLSLLPSHSTSTPLDFSQRNHWEQRE